MSQNCSIYFFVDSEGQICINHLNNTAEELREYHGYRRNYKILLFSYCYKTRNLYVTNVDDSLLTKILEALRETKKGSSVHPDMKDAVKQIEVASSFLKNKFEWKGDIFSRDSMDMAIIEKSVKDFDMVWSYLSLIFGGMKLDPIDIPVYIVDNLEHRSIFVPVNQEYDIDENIVGPAIVVRKTNSKYFMSEDVIYQYILNLHGIVDFSPGMEETYLRDTKEFVDRTLISFLRNGNLSDHTYWYIGKKDGKIYLNKNEYKSDSYQLISEEMYSSLLTFEYIVVEDSRYVIFKEISPGDVNDSNIYRGMLEFLKKNIGYIGHIDSSGNVIEEPPIFLFDGVATDFTIFRASNLPIWIIIETVLSVIYDFEPQDITVIRGGFAEPFSFKYINPDDNSEFVKKYLSRSDDSPIILWNTSSYDSVIGKWNKFIQEYMDFAFQNFSQHEDRNIKEEIKIFKDRVIGNAQNRFAMEMLVGLLCEEDPHMHQYNIFSIFSEFIGMTGVVTDEMLSETNETFDNETIEMIYAVQSSLFFLALKAMANFANIKHGINHYIDGKISKGDIVTDINCSCLLEVDAVLLEPNNKTNKNPDGITYCCKNLICGKDELKTMGEVKLFHLGFLDDEQYNEKRASSIKKESQQIGAEYYKKMLEQFLRRKKKSNPLDHTDDEDESHPSFDELLSKHRKNFNRTEGDAILENMLNNCRKVKSYGN